MFKQFRQITAAGGLALGCLLMLAESVLATKYAGEPFSLGVGGRALGRGGAYAASPGDATSVFWNPAALADPSESQLVAMHSETFGSLLNHDVVCFAWPGRENSRLAFGALFYHLGGGGIAVTALDSLKDRAYVLETRSHGDYMFGASLAYRAGSHWSWGLTGKFIYRTIAGRTAYGLGLDVGAKWNLTRLLTLGVKVADATGTYLSYDSSTNETIVPHVNGGGQINYNLNEWLIIGTFEVETFFENRRFGSQYWVGSVSADLHLGLEVGYRGVLFGRLGADVGRFTAGLGARLWRWDLDLAFLDHAHLDNSYRVSIGYRFK